MQKSISAEAGKAHPPRAIQLSVRALRHASVTAHAPYTLPSVPGSVPRRVVFPSFFGSLAEYRQVGPYINLVQSPAVRDCEAMAVDLRQVGRSDSDLPRRIWRSSSLSKAAAPLGRF